MGLGAFTGGQLIARFGAKFTFYVIGLTSFCLGVAFIVGDLLVRRCACCHDPVPLDESEETRLVQRDEQVGSEEKRLVHLECLKRFSAIPVHPQPKNN